MEGFSVPVSIAFCVNYVVGAGSLTLPWYVIIIVYTHYNRKVKSHGFNFNFTRAFQQSGGALGVLMMIVMAYFSISAILFIVEAMVRASLLADNVKGNEFEPLNKDDTFSVHKNNNAIVSKRKFEITELCEIFLGNKGKLAYAVIICVYMYGTLWVFATVFAHALSSHFPLGSPEFSYLVFLVLYGMIVVPVSCLELTEQVFIQVTLSICRIMMILTMLFTITIAFSKDNQPFLEFSNVNIQHSSLLRADYTKLYILLPIAAYANVFHHSIPALSHPVHDKSKLTSIFIYTTIFCLCAYSLIGCMISSYFGVYIKTSSNLNWVSYSGFIPAVDMAHIPW